jgi:hypothetical protein
MFDSILLFNNPYLFILPTISYFFERNIRGQKPNSVFHVCTFKEIYIDLKCTSVFIIGASDFVKMHN